MGLGSQVKGQRGIVGVGFGQDADGLDDAAVGKVEDLVNAGFLLFVLEVDDLYVAIIEGDFGEIELALVFDVEEESATALVNAEVQVYPFVFLGQVLAILPEQAFTGGRATMAGRHTTRGRNRSGRPTTTVVRAGRTTTVRGSTR